ncbi:unnamed protein product [Closterium sp. Yama58-4]|nr:unnamed protein product [Closterium sp. Yama58-4]
MLHGLFLVPLVAALACLAPWTALAQSSAQPIAIDQSQGPVLQQLKIPGWQVGSDCNQAQITCDLNGMITSLSVVCQSSSTVTVTLPSSMSDLSKLTSLHLESCGLGTNPESLTTLNSLASLVDLALPANGITSLQPLAKADYSDLQTLNLKSNPLGTDGLMDFGKFSTLASLDLSGCQLSKDHLLNDLYSPSMLYLNVANNNLAGLIPDNPASMTTLTYLDVSFNLLQGTLSPLYGSLTNLKTLAISGTGITCPDSYSSCGGVPQDVNSAFCRICSDFCATCDKPKPLPVGAIIGIVVGAIVVIVLVAFLLYYFCFMRGQRKGAVEQILIYEFMPNGDLSQWIGKEAATPLSFEQRVGVLVGAARGFEYLHSFGIVHRDIKPANILLNQNMQAKISDFGLVRKGDGNSAQSTRVVGTPGYVDPSYSASNRATTATDVYSFGIVILEVMTGRPAIEESLAIVSDEETTQSKNILTSVTQQLDQSGDVLGPGLKDPRIEAQDDLVLRVLQLALRCTAKRSATRPGMGAIAAELEGVLAELIGSKRNAAAEEVDKQILDLTPSADIEKQLARLDAAFEEREGVV